MKPRFHPSTRSAPRCAAQNSGFTLLESLIVVAVIGILSATAAPSFLGFWQRQQITTVQQMVYQAMRAAQADAIIHHEERQFSIRQQGDRLEWANHPRSVSPAQVSHWEVLPEGVVFSERDNTLPKAQGVRYVRFDFRGDVKYRLGTLTVASANGGNEERCVVVSTLIGGMRRGEGHAKPNSNGRYCY